MPAPGRNSPSIQRRSEVSAGVLAAPGGIRYRAANGRKLFFLIHVKIQIVISYEFACNKNKALQLQRVGTYLSSVSWAIALGLWLRPV